MMVYFPFFQCSFLPRFSIKIRTKYFNDNGSSQNVCILFLFVLWHYPKKVIGHFQKIFIQYHGRFPYFNPAPLALGISKVGYPSMPLEFQIETTMTSPHNEVKLHFKNALFSTDNAKTSRLFSFYLISD